MIVVARLAGSEKLERGHGYRPHVQMIGVEPVAERTGRSADRSGLVEGGEGAGLEAPFQPGRAAPGQGLDVDDAADGVRAVESALGPSQHFHAFQPRGQQIGEVEGSGRRARVADVDAVDNDLGVVGVGPSDEYRSNAAGPSGLHDIEARHGRKDVRRGALLKVIEVLGGDEGDAAGDLARRGRNRVGADDQWGDGRGAVAAVSGPRRPGLETQKDTGGRQQQQALIAGQG